MKFIRHTNLEGLHAPYSPSQSAWLRYNDEKAARVHSKKRAAERGSILHAWAKTTIDLGIKQPRSNKTLYAYVNDAIGYKMSTEVVLYYSDNFFGTTDAICFRNKFLRIHDLKTGDIEASMEQLEIYAALFCLEYKVDPRDIGMELRIYQNNKVLCHSPEPEDIMDIMNIIISRDKLLSKIDEGEV